MIFKPRCEKATVKRESPCLFCEGGAYCAYQYYCPETRHYENTPGFRACRGRTEGRRMTMPEEAAPMAAAEAPAAEAEQAAPVLAKEEKKVGAAAKRKPGRSNKRTGKG